MRALDRSPGWRGTRVNSRTMASTSPSEARWRLRTPVRALLPRLDPSISAVRILTDSTIGHNDVGEDGAWTGAASARIREMLLR